jgi:uncharacterized protein
MASTPEEEYFAKQEIEKKRKLAEQLKKEMVDEDRASLKKTHWMRCPKCGMELHEIVYRGVNIDKCFDCNGIYLDDGELEQLAGKESGFVGSMMSLFRS